jgi:hypothetical protein
VDYIAPHVALGLKSVIVFGVVVKNTSTKDGSGTCALSDSSPCAVAVRALKAAYGAKLLVATDVCLCGYTSHGHCGVFCADGKRIDQAASAEQIAQIGYFAFDRRVCVCERCSQHCSFALRARWCGHCCTVRHDGRTHCNDQKQTDCQWIWYQALAFVFCVAFTRACVRQYGVSDGVQRQVCVVDVRTVSTGGVVSTCVW